MSIRTLTRKKFTFAVLLILVLGVSFSGSFLLTAEAKNSKWAACKSHSKTAPKMKLSISTKSYIRTTESKKKKRTQTIRVKSVCYLDKVVYKSSNPKIAKVTAIKGTNKAKLTTYLGKRGTTTITATIKNKKTGKVRAVRKQKITVYQGATGVRIVDANKKELKSASLALNGTMQLYSQIKPSNVNASKQKKVSWSIAAGQEKLAVINSKNVLTPEQKNLLGRDVQTVTVILNGYKSGSQFVRKLNVKIDGGKLAVDRNIDQNDLTVKVKLTVAGDLSSLNGSTLTLKGLDGKAAGKNLKAVYAGTASDQQAIFKIENPNGQITDGTGNYNGTYQVESSIRGIVFSNDQTVLTTSITQPTDQIDLTKEAAKFQNVSYKDSSVVGDSLGMSLSEPLTDGCSYEIALAANDYIEAGTDKQSLTLKKLNLTESPIQLNVTVKVRHPDGKQMKESVITATLPVSEYIPPIKLEAAKFLDVSYTEDSEIGDILEMSLSEPLSAGYSYKLVVEENDYFESTPDKQSFKLLKFNLSNGVITGNFAISVEDTLRQITVTQDISVTLPRSKYLTALENELSKFSNVKFTETAEENDELEMQLSEPLSADYLYEITIPDNEYIEADSSKQKVVLKQKNETGNGIIQSIPIKVKDTVRNISMEKTIRVTIPNYVYYGAKIGTLQMVGYHEEDISYNADVSTFFVAYELDDVIDTATLSASDFIIQGMDKDCTVSVSNFEKNTPQVVTMDVKIIAPDGDEKNYTISVQFVNN